MARLSHFTGTLLHPSLDIKKGVVIVGFRMRDDERKNKNVFVVMRKRAISVEEETEFDFDGERLFIELATRTLKRIESCIDPSALDKFIENFQSGKPIEVYPNKIFETVRTIIKEHVELEHEADYTLIAAWIIGTYVFPAFSAFPFLNIKAPKGSGKSQLLSLLELLCFNAVKSRATAAAMCDTTDALRGTFLIDQADSLKLPRNEELLDILTDSYKHGGGKRRFMVPNKQKRWEVAEQETYGPKAFASIGDLPEDLRDRCILIPLVRSGRNFPYPDPDSERWPNLRMEMYKFLLDRGDIVADMYEITRSDARALNGGLTGRRLELWTPVRVMLQSLAVDSASVDEAQRRYVQNYGFNEYQLSEFDEAVLRAVVDLLGENQGGDFAPADIAKGMDGSMFKTDSTVKQRGRLVGYAIRRLNLSTEELPRTRHGKRYRFELERVHRIADNYIHDVSEHALDTQNAKNKDPLDDF